ncbi:MAG: hypothetical protein GQ581_08040 [Methyloprofundus sp.]|nr:hypothetical protein [Methyloprofundus sp.]
MTHYQRSKTKIAASITALLLGTASINAQAATGSFDPATATIDLPVLEIATSSNSPAFHVTLSIVNNAGVVELQLDNATPVANIEGQRNTFDPTTQALHIADLPFDGKEYYAKLKLIPNSNPLRFSVEQLVNNAFEACPSFATDGPISGTCVLNGTITEDITLTSNTQWLLDGDVYIGGDKTDNAILTINPGTHIFGQQGADFLWIRRGSKIMSEGTPSDPVVMSGAEQLAAGEWGGLVIAGNSHVNGCLDSNIVCEVPFEAITSESYGGNDIADNSGVLKYTQILFAGFQVRPDEELNGLTLLSVGSGTTIDYVQVHAGEDDGVEMFGGSVNMKHMVLTDINDDSLDWGGGWTGKAQFVLVKQSAVDGDRGIEADNNKANPDIGPRSNPTLSNMTMLGSSAGSQGVLLRRGTGVNIWNSVFTGFGSSCLRIDGDATYANAGTLGDLSGGVTIQHSIVDCATNFTDEADKLFLVSDWFNTQMANQATDPQLNGYMPAASSPLLTGGMPVSGDAFFDSVNYVGAFKDANDDWTKGWTFAF